MPKGLAIEGTKHTVSLGREEPAILDAIRDARAVRKLNPMWVTWTGPTEERLEIRRGRFPWLIEVFLFLGSGKRTCQICVDASTTLYILRVQLEQALRKFGIPVIYKEEQNMNENNGCEARQLSAEQRWAQCLMIYEYVKGFKKLEEDEKLIDLEIEDLMAKKDQLLLQQEEYRAQALGAEVLRKVA